MSAGQAVRQTAQIVEPGGQKHQTDRILRAVAVLSLRWAAVISHKIIQAGRNESQTGRES